MSGLCMRQYLQIILLPENLRRLPTAHQTFGRIFGGIRLLERVLLRVDGLAADGHILCRAVYSSLHQHSARVVSNSLRLLAVSSGDELKRPCGIASWCGAAIGALGRQVCGARLRPIDDGNGHLCSDKF